MHNTQKAGRGLIVILVYKNSIVCAEIARGIYKPYRLNAISANSHEQLIASAQGLIQTQRIGTWIRTFLTKYQHKEHRIALIIDEPIITQGYATTIDASAQAYLVQNLAMPHTHIETLYLHPHEDRFLHWWSRCHYALLLQVQLLAKAYRANIVRVMPAFPALFALYKTIRGTTFHPLQCAADLAAHNYDIGACIDHQVARQLAEGLPTNIEPHIAKTLVGAAIYEGL